MTTTPTPTPVVAPAAMEIDPINTIGAAFFLCGKIQNSDGTSRSANFSMELNKEENHLVYPTFLKVFKWLGNMSAPRHIIPYHQRDAGISDHDLVIVIRPEAIQTISAEKKRLMDSLCHFMEGYFGAIVYYAITPDTQPTKYSNEITLEQIQGPTGAMDVRMGPTESFPGGHMNSMYIEITQTTWSFRAQTQKTMPDGTYLNGILMDDFIAPNFASLVDEIVTTHGHYYP